MDVIAAAVGGVTVVVADDDGDDDDDDGVTVTATPLLLQILLLLLLPGSTALTPLAVGRVKKGERTKRIVFVRKIKNIISDRTCRLGERAGKTLKPRSLRVFRCVCIQYAIFVITLCTYCHTVPVRSNFQ